MSAADDSSTAEPAICMPVVNQDVEDAVVNATDTSTDDIQQDNTKKPGNIIATTNRKRLCRFPGCERVIKSQGHCQRHGARAKRCRHPSGCDKQAQGTHEGMCKRHWRMVQNQNRSIDEVIPPNSNKIRLSAPPPPSGISVYESIIPNSMAYRPTPQQIYSALASPPNTGNTADTSAPTTSNTAESETTPSTVPFEPIVPPQYDPHSSSMASHNTKGQQLVMPLVHYLAVNMHLPIGWHRIHERRARGVYPITSIATQLEGWERQLALIEICLLSGGTPQANFKHFCHAWGRDATFVSRLSNFICERRGDSERKKARPTEGAVVDKRNLKKSGVIIPRTTPLEIYRSGIAEAVTKSDIVEQAVAAIIEQAVESTVDEVEMDVTNRSTNSSNNNDHRVLDTMLGPESEQFLLMDESADDTNPHDHPEMAQV